MLEIILFILVEPHGRLLYLHAPLLDAVSLEDVLVVTHLVQQFLLLLTLPLPVAHVEGALLLLQSS